MGHEPQLVPDIYLLLIQGGIFLATWFMLHVLVFKPYLALLELRHSKTDGLKEQAEADRKAAHDLQAQYDNYMKEERKKITAVVDQERQKISDEERAIVSGARDQMAEELKRVQATAAAEYEKARTDLLRNVSDYSSHLASKVVGYELRVPVHENEISKMSAIEPMVNT